MLIGVFGQDRNPDFSVDRAEEKRSGFDPQPGVDRWGVLVIVAAAIPWSKGLQF